MRWNIRMQCTHLHPCCCSFIFLISFLSPHGGSLVWADTGTPGCPCTLPSWLASPSSFLQGPQTPHTHKLLFSLLKFQHSQSSDYNWCFTLQSMFSYHFSSAVYSPFTWGSNKKAKRNPNTICINLLAGSQFLLNIATVYFGFNRTFLKLKASREVSGFWTKHFLPSWKQQQETNSSGQNWIIKMKNHVCFWSLNCYCTEW